MRQPIFPSDLAKTVHFVGDLHFGALSVARQNKLANDLLRGTVPKPICRIQVGDNVNDGSSDAAAQAFYAQFTDAPLRVIPGNHDTNGVRSTAQWAAVMAAYLEGGVYPWTKDLGFVRLIAVGDFNVGVTLGSDPTTDRPYLPQAHLDYLDAALAAANGQDCWILSHAPLYNTVLGLTTGDNPQWISTEPFFFAHAPTPTSADSSAITSVLAAHPNAKAWFCGHTHSSIQAPGFLSTLTIGGRSFAHVNVSAIYYVARTLEWIDPIRTLYVTKTSTGLEIRIRDHGQGCWVGINGVRVPTMVIT
jgi:3',5'-cyclic AMP phosphodiesterase CpdA